MDLSRMICLCNDMALQTWIAPMEMHEFAYLYAFHLSDEAIRKIGRNLSDSVRKEMLLEKERMSAVFSRSYERLKAVLEEAGGYKTNGIILITDLVGSTEKNNALGDDKYYEAVLLPHNRIIENCIANAGGFTVKTIGDSYLAILGLSATASVLACSMAQAEVRAMNAGREPEYRFSVRMALHTGVYQYKAIDDMHVDVFGSAINYAARLAGVAGGNEICVSETMRERLLDEMRNWDNYRRVLELSTPEWLPRQEVERFRDGVQIRSCGRHSFKGFEGEQETYTVSG